LNGWFNDREIEKLVHLLKLANFIATSSSKAPQSFNLKLKITTCNLNLYLKIAKTEGKLILFLIASSPDVPKKSKREEVENLNQTQNR
jgi:hypothetical protein